MSRPSVDDKVVIGQDIQVNRPGTVPERGNTTDSGFDFLEELQKFDWGDICFDLRLRQYQRA